MRSLLLVALLVGSSLAQSGGCGCGGGGGGGGGCGGCKHKARGVLRLEGDDAVDEDFGEIYGLSLWESPKLPANVTIEQAVRAFEDPDFHFKSCCSARGLSDACVAHCNFQSYSQNLLQNMLVGSDECPLDSLPEIHFCAAQGRDHSSCCRNKIPDKFTPIDYTYASCFGKFNEMKQCFHSTIAQKAKAFFTHNQH